MPHAAELWQTMVKAGAQTLVMGASPYSWNAPGPGTVTLSGGTLSAVSLARDTVTATLPLAGAVPVSRGDVVTITYVVAPVVKFFPQ